MSKLLDLSDSDDDSRLKINNNYAERYDNWRQKEELQKFKDRYGEKATCDFNSLNDEDSTSSSSSEDDEEITKEFDKNFYKTLSYLKKKDPKIYDTKTKFFPEESSSQQENKTNKNINKKDKPLFLRDYERELIINKNGHFIDEDENVEKKLTIVQKNKNLIESFKAKEDSDDELFTTKKYINKEKDEDEEDDYVELLKGQKVDFKDKESQNELKPLQEYWTDPNLDSKEAFLRDFLLNERSLKDNEEESDFKLVDQDDEEEQSTLAKQEEFEHKYNFRFEEPDTEFIKRYPRLMENSIRKKDNKRKEQRDQYKERKEQEKAQKIRELNQFKAIKRKEIMDKIEKLKEITGNTDVGFQEDDLEGDFDPETHDKRMQELFDGEFYQGPEDDQKPEFKDIDEELELENWDQWNGEKDIDDDDQYNEDENTAGDSTVPFCEDPNFNMDCDYDPNSKNFQDELIENTKDKKKRRKKSKFAKALLKKKPAYNPEGDKSFEEYFDEYYKLDFEDIIGDMPCRFKYRQVQANDFGLTTDEVLNAPERELNRWCSLKKAVQYRDEKSELYDLEAFKSKGQNIYLKQKILPSLYKTPSDEVNSQKTENLPTKKKRIRSKRRHLLIEEKINKKTEENSDSNENIMNSTKNLKLDSDDKKVNDIEKEKSGERIRSKRKHLLIEKEINKKTEENENIMNPTKKLKLDSDDKKVNDIEKEKSGEVETKKVELIESNMEKKEKNKKSANNSNKRNKKNKKIKNKNEELKSKKMKIFNKLEQSDKLKMSLSDDRLKAYGFNPKKFKNKIIYKPKNE